MTQMNDLLNKLAHSRAAQAITASAIIVGGFAASALAGATGTYDPTDDLKLLGANTTSTAAPILIAVVGSLIGLGVVFWVARKVMRIFGIKF